MFITKIDPTYILVSKLWNTVHVKFYSIHGHIVLSTDGRTVKKLKKISHPTILPGPILNRSLLNVEKTGFLILDRSYSMWTISLIIYRIYNQLKKSTIEIGYYLLNKLYLFYLYSFAQEAKRRVLQRYVIIYNHPSYITEACSSNIKQTTEHREATSSNRPLHITTSTQNTLTHNTARAPSLSMPRFGSHICSHTNTKTF